MKIPGKLKRAIGPLDITIKLNPRLHADFGLFGRWNPGLGEIELEASLTYQQKAETFLHEIIEAFNDGYFLQLNHEQISVLGMAMGQVMMSLEEAYGKEIGG